MPAWQHCVQLPTRRAFWCPLDLWLLSDLGHLSPLGLEPGTTEAFCLDRLHRDLGLGHLPRFFGTATTCLLSPHLPVVTAAAQCLQVLLPPAPALVRGTESLRGASAAPSPPELARGLWPRPGEEVLGEEADFLEASGSSRLGRRSGTGGLA